MSVTPLNYALHQALEQQNNEAIVSLSAQNADVNNLDQDELPPLFYAVDRNYPEVVKTLIVCKANVNLVFYLDEMDEITTVLHDAVSNGQIDILKMLLQAKADVTQRERSGYSPLHLAAMDANEKAVMVLLEYGAHPDMQDNRENTPLHLVASDELEVMDENMGDTIETLIRTLVNAKADINALNEDGDTPLALLVKKVEERRAHWRQPNWPSATCLSLVSHGAEIPEHIEGRVLEFVSPLPISQLRLFMVELYDQKRQKLDS